MPKLVHPESTAHADHMARREAVLLAALAGNHWPKPFMHDDSMIAQPVIERAMPFAANARRVLDHLGWQITIEETTFQNDVQGAATLQQDFRKALNGIVHATSLHVEFCQNPGEMSIFEGVAAFVPVYLRYQTDRYSPERVSIYDMAFAYLRQPKLIVSQAEVEK